MYSWKTSKAVQLVEVLIGLIALQLGHRLAPGSVHLQGPLNPSLPLCRSLSACNQQNLPLHNFSYDTKHLQITKAYLQLCTSPHWYQA